MDDKNSIAKSLLLIVGFIATVVAIAGAVYGVIKYLEKRKTDEFMDYYFDEELDYDEALEEDNETQTDEEE